jgi:hypothetical protein
VLVPYDVAARYQNVNEAVSLVINDIDQHDGFAVRTFNDFIEWAEPRGVHARSPPPLPLPPRGDPHAQTYEGGAINGVVTFQAATPIHRPSVFLYLVLENYVSNVVGLDLVDVRPVPF